MNQGSIALAGGGEFRPGCDDMDWELLGLSAPRRPSVLVVPTAAFDNPRRAVDNGVAHFRRLGAQASALMVMDREDADNPDLAAELANHTHVYFAGGSPVRLLSVLRDSLLAERLGEWLHKGGILAGSSAGAMVMGSYMRSPPTREWVRGLNLCPGVAVLPHHEDSDPAQVAQALAGRVNGFVNVMGVDAQTGALFSGGRWRVVGAGNVTTYVNGKFTVYGPGQFMPSMDESPRDDDNPPNSLGGDPCPS